MTLTSSKVSKITSLNTGLHVFIDVAIPTTVATGCTSCNVDDDLTMPVLLAAQKGEKSQKAEDQQTEWYRHGCFVC